MTEDKPDIEPLKEEWRITFDKGGGSTITMPCFGWVIEGDFVHITVIKDGEAEHVLTLRARDVLRFEKEGAIGSVFDTAVRKRLHTRNAFNPDDLCPNCQQVIDLGTYHYAVSEQRGDIQGVCTVHNNIGV